MASDKATRAPDRDFWVVFTRPLSQGSQAGIAARTDLFRAIRNPSRHVARVSVTRPAHAMVVLATEQRTARRSDIRLVAVSTQRGCAILPAVASRARTHARAPQVRRRDPKWRWVGYLAADPCRARRVRVHQFASASHPSRGARGRRRVRLSSSLLRGW